MSAVRWVTSFAVFLLLLLFSLQNTDRVQVRFYGLFSWQAPLVFLLLIAFALGVSAGLLAGVVRTVRLKRQLSRLRGEHSKQLGANAAPPLDAA